MTAPPRPASPSFRLVRYFALTSLAVFLPVAGTLLYFDREEDNLFKQLQQEQSALFAQMQESFAQRHNAAAPAFLLSVYEAGNVNLTRLFANALWDEDFAPFVANAQRIPVEQCRALAEDKDAGGKAAVPGGKQACFADVGRQIMALPGFKALNARVYETAKKSSMLKIKVYDLRGITVYSSEHSTIGEDRRDNADWQSAVAGKPSSQLTHRDKFIAFEGAVENRDVVASYAPVRAHGSESIVAVVEVYSDVTPFLARIESTSAEILALSNVSRAQLQRLVVANQDQLDKAGNLMSALVVGLLALFYCALFMIVRNGQRIIDKQDLDRKQAGLALSRQKNLYDALSQTNKAMVYLVDRDELFEAICRISVEHGRFRFAWVGLFDNDQSLRPAARYGEDAGYIDQLGIPGDGANGSKRGLAGQTLLSGTYVISNDFLNDPAMAPWCEAARRAGVRASAKFPIREAGAVIGAINLYAGEPGYFTEDLVATLDEMAGDVSFALDNYAREAARKQAESALREGEERYRQMFQANPHPMWVYDAETLAFLAVNDAAVAHYGWSREQFLAMTIADIRPAEEVPALLEYLGEERRKAHRSKESWRHRTKDGVLIDVEITSHSIEFGGRRARVVSAHDITERKRTDDELRAAAEQFRGLVEQSIAGTYIIQDGKFVYLNPRLAEILGYGSAGELVGSDPLSVVADKDRSIVAENIRRRREGETSSVAYNFTAQRKDGSMIDVGVHGAAATYRNRPAIIGLMQDITEKKRAEEQIQHYVAQLEKAFMHTVEVARTLSEMRDPYTAGHERRVAEIAVAIGVEVGFDAHRAEGLRVAGYLHDIGKITVPVEILSKPGKLNAAEFMMIKGHAQAGYDILKNVGFPWPVAMIVLQHHERPDGSGYPQGLKGDAILLEARIMAVADVVEAMSSHRPYRPGLGIEKALAEIERGRGAAYDVNVADACLRLFREKGYAIPV